MSENNYHYTENPFHVTRREFITITGLVAALIALPALWLRSRISSNNAYIQARTKGLYTDDVRSKIRVSHANKSVARYYREFGGKPLSHLSEQLLHTKYINRTKTLV